MAAEPVAAQATAAPPAPPRRALLAALFALSGCASLMDQVVWLRYLALSFGNTTYAAATLLAIFLGGLALGAVLFGRWADRLLRPLTVFALVEVGVALIALASPWMFGLIDAAYVVLYRSLGSHPALFAGGRALLAAAILLPPTVLMGATLPLILRAAVPGRTAAGPGSRVAAVGRASALFYAVNTLGATAGVAIAGIFTIRLLGLTATLVLAAGLDLLAGLGCALLSRPLPKAAPEERPEMESPKARAGAAPPPRRRARLGRGALLTLFFAMGATSLAYEVLWTRILVFYLGSNVYAYSLMLLGLLLGIGCGSLLAVPWADRVRSPLAALAWIEGAIGLWTLPQVLLFHNLNDSFAALAAALRPHTFAGASAVMFVAIAPILLPPTLLMGISFPLAVRAASRGPAKLGGDVGSVYGANTIGTVAGSLVTGFILIPWVGTQNSLLAVGAANAALGTVIAFRFAGGRRRRGLRWAWLAPPAAILAAGLWLPADAVVLSAGIFRHDEHGDLLELEEDASATVTVRRVRHPGGEPYLSLELNGVNVAGTTPDNYAVQKLQGHLPMLLLERTRGARVAHVGLGSGATAHAVSLHPVEAIRVIEISPAVPRAAERWFEPINGGVLDDPRLTVEINDGRNFMLATRERFDAVLSDSIHPRYAGNGSLYTEEYFRLLRRRLEPGGAVSMWLPMYSMRPTDYAGVLAAFVAVFPRAAVWYEPSALNSFTVVTATVDRGPWEGEALAAAFADPAVAQELAEIGLDGPADLLACQLLSGDVLHEWLAGAPPHQDDLPAVEYGSGSLIDRNWTWLVNFATLLALRPESPPEEWLAALPPTERERAAERWMLYGEWMAAHRDFLWRQLGDRLR